MEISQYISIARRWAWLLILGLVVGTGSGYGAARLQTPIYQASTRILVSHASLQAAASASPNSNYYYVSDQQLIDTYLELLKASSIYDSVSQTVNYPVSYGQVQTAQVSDTDIISITVTDTDPKRAADIANAVATALIKQNDDLQAGQYNASDASIQSQIQQVQAQMAQTQSDLDNLSTSSVAQQLAQVKAQLDPLQAQATLLQQNIAKLTPAYSLADKAKLAGFKAQLDQITPLLNLYQQVYSNLVVLGNTGNLSSSTTNTTATRLQSMLTMYQQIYQSLLSTSEAIRLQRLQNTQSITQVQAAVPPSGPISPRPLQSAGLAGAVGLMLAAGVVFLIEYLDNTLKVPEDVDRVLGLPLIGYIAEMQPNSKHEQEVYVARQPRSPVSEAFRSLRTNLEFAAVDKPLRTILVTGAEAGDGKTTIATNLAAIFAQSGKRVMLLDTDLRRPRVHRFLGIQNRVGLTDLFRENMDIDAVSRPWADTNSKSLSVITTGSLPPNPTELLGSHKMDLILAKIASRVDVVIMDSPPSVVADAQVLAAKVDCVLLVVQPGKTHADAARAMREQLKRAGARLVVVVFNRIPRSQGYYYGGYQYYSPYYSRNHQYLPGNDDGADSEVIDMPEAGPESPQKSSLRKLPNRENRSDK
ncbi:MAG TPA: polysaccharide biosynthesis tyrosine autokinase [Anaerolineales bacterium]|nr:polysaccharide biosynthesis tyrosine autokinase [Anaerolineales bacterium]